MGGELTCKWLLKEGVGIFSRTLCLENRPTPFESTVGQPKYSKIQICNYEQNSSKTVAGPLQLCFLDHIRDL